MAEKLWIVLVLLLSLVGCLHCIRWIVLKLLSPRAKETGIWVLPLTGRREDTEYVIRGLISRRRWDCFRGEAVLLDAGLDPESREIARRLCEEYGGLRLMAADEFMKFVSLSGLQVGEKLI
ncbi:MAG: hypothetical protein FWE80_05305 [Oscillospiraceae bacterium]|nr:hypothetical protein [Oscillospiraceae bacterium]